MPVLFDRQPPGEAEGKALCQPLGAGQPGFLGDPAAHEDVLGGVRGEQNRQRPGLLLRGKRGEDTVERIPPFFDSAPIIAQPRAVRECFLCPEPVLRNFSLRLAKQRVIKEGSRI